MPIKKTITVEEAVEVLNRAYKADPVAMAGLRYARAVCNEKLAQDPTIQVSGEMRSGRRMVGGDVVDGEPRMEYSVSYLGILNGLFGIDERTGHGAIAASYALECPNGCSISEDETLHGTRICPVCHRGLEPLKLLGFEVVDHDKLPSLGED